MCLFVLMRMWENRRPISLLVGEESGTVILESKLAVLCELKGTITL